VGHDGTVWAINTEQQVFRYQNNNWVPIYGKFQQIALGNDEQIWGIGLHGELFQLGPSIAEYQALQDQLVKLREAKQEENHSFSPLNSSPVDFSKENTALVSGQLSQLEQLLEQNQVLQQKLMGSQAQTNGLQMQLNELVRLNKTRQYQISILQQQNYELQKQVGELEATKQELELQLTHCQPSM
jgi:chromosome segregation ATPase